MLNLKEAPAGGGNQFLKSLKKYMQTINAYEENPLKAEVILLNSHHNIIEAAKLKLQYPEKLFIHRVDGPMRVYNQKNDKRDDFVLLANSSLTDATVFQSCWSRENNHMLKINNKFETIIHNAPDASIFNRDGKAEFVPDRKTRLIASSWSKNWNKGFASFQWIDKHLDFDKYEMCFIGESPVGFKNIKHINSLSSRQLAQELKKSDIYIFASKFEACSNSLLEALHCGLPVVGDRGSSNSELIVAGGETFSRPEEIPGLLEIISCDYKAYQANIQNPSIEEIGQLYYDFMCLVYNNVQSGNYKPKQINQISYWKIYATILGWKLSQKIAALKN